MMRLVALVALAAAVCTACSCSLNKYYRTASPESPLNLTLEANRPEKLTERIFLIGNVLKVIYFENTDHEYVYVPLRLGIDHEGEKSAGSVWTTTKLAIYGLSSTADEVGKEQKNDYLLVEDHRHLGLENLHHDDMWELHYRQQWLSRTDRLTETSFPEQTLQSAQNDSAGKVFAFKQISAEQDQVDYTEVGLRLITRREFFKLGEYYRLEFTPEQGPPVSYVVQVDRNNAIVGATIGLTIVAVALAASAGN